MPLLAWTQHLVSVSMLALTQTPYIVQCATPPHGPCPERSPSGQHYKTSVLHQAVISQEVWFTDKHAAEIVIENFPWTFALNMTTNPCCITTTILSTAKKSETVEKTTNEQFQFRIRT